MTDTVTIAEPSPVKPRRWLRNLRIAVSVFFCVLTVALCVLWVRSYTRHESARFTGWKSLVILTTWQGNGVLLRHRLNPKRPRIQTWRLDSEPYASDHNMKLGGKPVTGERVVIARTANAFMMAIPLWSIFAFTCVLIPVSWLLPFPANFSLRTMLIATTLVAVGLGLAVWAGRG